MSEIDTRRTFLKGSMAAGAVGVAIGAGLLHPGVVLARNDNAFMAKASGDAMSAAFGSGDSAASDAITIKAPDIAENGAVVPVTVETTLAADEIAILADKNPTPMAARFMLSSSATGDVSTRIKMGKTGDVIAVVKSGGKLYSARKPVKVTIGGCGG